MKNYKIYIVALIAITAGLVLGWIMFGGKSSTDQNHQEGQTSQMESEIWTCSMHPQIRQNEPGDCPICGMDLIPAKQSNNSNSNGFQMTDEAIQMANIQTSIIGGYADGESATLKLTGKIQANETKAASLVTHIPGRIEKLYVSYEGEQVIKGQKIATVYSPELITAQKELLEAQKIEKISPGILNAAKNKLKYWKIDQQVVEDILQTGTIHETFNIYADYSGIVDLKKVSVGDYLTTGEVLFDIQNLNTLWALFDVYESDLSLTKIGQEIKFTTPSAPNKVFSSNVTFVNPVINPETRVASIRTEVNNSNGKLKPEMFIQGELISNQSSEEQVVPKSAVLWTGQRSVVYVKIPDSEIPSFEFREVKIGDATKAGYKVISGLDTGEEVVTNGAFVIDASAQLNNQASMMNRNVTVKKATQKYKLPDYTASTPQEFQDQLAILANFYFPVKDALVQSDGKQAAIAAQELLSKIEKVNMTLVKGEAHIYWMEQVKALKAHGQKITEVQEIEEQRQQFDFLSRALIGSLKVFGVNKETFFVQHCPMANDNAGADWLSEHEKILNPYFGEKMLKCGSVMDTIQTKSLPPSEGK